MSDTKSLIKKLRRLGFDVKQARRSGHWHVYRDGRLIAVVAATPSCSRSLLNARAQLRRSGIAV
jgi:hypothetical protein